MRVLATTVPKTGTHLLMQVLGEHKWLPWMKGHGCPGILSECGVVYPPGKRDKGVLVSKVVETIERRVPSVVMGHVPFVQEVADALVRTDAKVVMLVRDPRDTVVAHYRSGEHYNFHYADGTMFKDREDPLMDAIRLAPHWWKAWLPWITGGVPVHIVRYEDLIGPGKQAAIDALAETVGFRAKDALQRVRPRSLTFRKGVAGEWQHEFGPEHVKLFEATMASTMETLGYG